MKVNPKIRALYNDMSIEKLIKQLDYLYGKRGLSMILGDVESEYYISNQIAYIKALLKSWSIYMNVELVY